MSTTSVTLMIYGLIMRVLQYVVESRSNNGRCRVHRADEPTDRNAKKAPGTTDMSSTNMFRDTTSRIVCVCTQSNPVGV